jgi:hypothetical protein
MEERREIYRAFVGKPDGKRPLGKPRRRWEDNIKIDIQEMECFIFLMAGTFIVYH